MPTNTEIKFLVEQSNLPADLLARFSFDDERVVKQEDIYALSTDWFLKLRINDGVPAKALRYKRLTSPTVRESEYQPYDIESDSEAKLTKFIFDTIPLAGVVRKTRRQLRCARFLLNVDTVYNDDWRDVLYVAVEIEAFAGSSLYDGLLVESVLQCFQLKQFQMLPYSNIHMVNMIKRSQEIHEKMKDNNCGRLILIDGGSGTGKSTVKDILMSEYELGYARRDTTRKPRPDDLLSGDYSFVSMSEFGGRALRGGYLEFRDFLFGMSYGLPWDEFVGPILDGRNMMALINLGNGFFTKRLFPSATLVLLHASQDVIQSRLRSRGGLTEAQLKERLENNRLAESYVDAYDVAIDTGQYSAEEVAEMIAKR